MSFPSSVSSSVTFDEAVSTLSRYAGVPVHVREEVLRAFRHADVPVELSLKDVPVYRALEFLLQTQRGGYSGDVPDYGVDGGMIVISTRTETSALVITRAYNLRQWLWQDLFEHNADVPHEEGQGVASKLLMDHVAPDSWKENGGPSGSISFFDDVMIVTQTWPNHEKIRRFLLDLQGAVGSPSTQPVMLHAQ